MFARLLTTTRHIQLALNMAGFNRRGLIRLTPEEWAELCEDLEFRKMHDGRDFAIMHDVVIRPDKPVTVSAT